METNQESKPARFNVRVGERYLGQMSIGQPLSLVPASFRYPFTENEAIIAAASWDGAEIVEYKP